MVRDVDAIAGDSSTVDQVPVLSTSMLQIVSVQESCTWAALAADGGANRQHSSVAGVERVLEETTPT